MLSTDCAFAVDSIENVQVRYQRNYERRVKHLEFQLEQQVLVCIPQEEQGKLRKLSHPVVTTLVMCNGTAICSVVLLVVDRVIWPRIVIWET